MTNAVHMNKRVSAAALRDTATTSDYEALRQNGLTKAPSDPEYPISVKLRDEYNHPELANVLRPQNPLSMKRGLDSTNCPTFKMLRMKARFDLLLRDSPLLQAIQAIFEASKQNQGNQGARGRSLEERDSYEADFDAITNLPLETPFYVRSKDTDDPVPTNPLHPIFPAFTKEGLIGRLMDKRHRRGNTNAVTAVRSSTLLSLYTVQGIDSRAQQIGVNGKNSFILCQLKERLEDQTKNLEQQMQEIEATNVGQGFWVRINNKAPRTCPNPGPVQDGTVHICYNLPAFNSVRDDRLKKTKGSLGKSINKVMKGARPIKSSDGHFVLCKIVSV
ncbi:unknown protein [Seminavis robusta]|uniref:Uncharacterized protein n=1 Tax=Seminavis robusta TaxID=568900 RepID=A0A9N8HQV4_9STRA|nr:unknown protein [Seminavis robusta]|eukprot:Sro1240_g255320.1 n/a (332) ;mRNA; r:6094-7204